MYTIGKQKEISDSTGDYNHYLVTTFFFPEKLFIGTINQGETPLTLIFSGKEIESVKILNHYAVYQEPIVLRVN